VGERFEPLEVGERRLLASHYTRLNNCEMGNGSVAISQPRIWWCIMGPRSRPRD